MSQTRVAQFRLTGPCEGIRVLRHVEGAQRWRLHMWLQRADGWRDEREIFVNDPVPMRALTPLYEKYVNELCADTPTVTAGGFDAYLLPKQRRG